jgi:hypothetical protein
MSYTPFSHCPHDSDKLVESLILRGRHPLPRRWCFIETPQKPTSSLSQKQSTKMRDIDKDEREKEGTTEMGERSGDGEEKWGEKNKIFLNKKKNGKSK